MDSKTALRYLPSAGDHGKTTAIYYMKFRPHLSTGGHRSEDAKGNGIWCIRLRVRPDYSGIDLLPAPDLKP